MTTTKPKGSELDDAFMSAHEAVADMHIEANVMMAEANEEVERLRGLVAELKAERDDVLRQLKDALANLETIEHRTVDFAVRDLREASEDPE